MMWNESQETKRTGMYIKPTNKRDLPEAKTSRGRKAHPWRSVAEDLEATVQALGRQWGLVTLVISGLKTRRQMGLWDSLFKEPDQIKLPSHRSVRDLVLRNKVDSS